MLQRVIFQAFSRIGNVDRYAGRLGGILFISIMFASKTL
jgi:hypothetical protein